MIKFKTHNLIELDKLAKEHDSDMVPLRYTVILDGTLFACINGYRCSKPELILLNFPMKSKALIL